MPELYNEDWEYEEAIALELLQDNPRLDSDAPEGLDDWSESVHY